MCIGGGVVCVYVCVCVRVCVCRGGGGGRGDGKWLGGASFTSDFYHGHAQFYSHL